MERKFEGTPQADIRLEGRKVIRSEVTDDWGSRLQWVNRRNGQATSLLDGHEGKVIRDLLA